jgi:hypothetical protein
MKAIERLLVTLGLGAALAAPSLASERASFQGLGFVQAGDDQSSVSDLSADGTPVVGVSTTQAFGGGFHGFRSWSVSRRARS